MKPKTYWSRDTYPTYSPPAEISALRPCATWCPREMFNDVGGFWPERLLGARVEHVPAAVYRVTVNPAGRNSTIDRPHTLHREILRSHAQWLRTRKAPQ